VNIRSQKHLTERKIRAAFAALRSVDDVKQKISPCCKHGASITDADMLCGLKSAQRQNQHRIRVIPTPSEAPNFSSGISLPYPALRGKIAALLRHQGR